MARSCEGPCRPLPPLPPLRPVGQRRLDCRGCRSRGADSKFTLRGAVAQLGERLDRTQEVRGSSPLSSTQKLPLGVTGNTPDSGSGESWFEPRRGNSKRDAQMMRVALLVFLGPTSVLQAFTPLPLLDSPSITSC